MTDETIVNEVTENADAAGSAQDAPQEAGASAGTVAQAQAETPASNPEDAEIAAYVAKLKECLDAVPANASAVPFPADPWGMTTDIRKAGLLAASSVRGNKLKHVMFIGTLQLLMKHAQVRFEVDRAELEKTLREIAEAESKATALNRVYGTPVPAEAA